MINLKTIKKMKLKDWDLEEFKAGAKPCYSDGEPCEVHIWEDGSLTSRGKYSLMLDHCPLDGILTEHQRFNDIEFRLKLLPKETGWINIYKAGNGGFVINKQTITKNKELALTHKAVYQESGINYERIATIEIEWEE